jgi:glycosyltransferase involved in cell wall biosynthesis
MVNDDLEQGRSTRLRAYAISQALARLETERPGFAPEAIVASICAYEEEGNIAHVLEKMPVSVNGEPYTTLVVVDGGDDRTAEIARSFPGVVVIYRYCVNHNVKYVVTLDADGQNDPSEIPQILVPLTDDTSDFVLGSRVLGVDKTTDRVRKLGVRFFSFIMNRMTGSHITDTSTGYRALRVTMLADVVDRLRQQQYQTSELLITCLKRGWRVSEVPTEWYPRVSGETKKGATWTYGFRYSRVVFGTWWRER